MGRRKSRRTVPPGTAANARSSSPPGAGWMLSGTVSIQRHAQAIGACSVCVSESVAPRLTVAAADSGSRHTGGNSEVNVRRSVSPSRSPSGSARPSAMRPAKSAGTTSSVSGVSLAADVSASTGPIRRLRARTALRPTAAATSHPRIATVSPGLAPMAPRDAGCEWRPVERPASPAPLARRHR